MKNKYWYQSSFIASSYNKVMIYNSKISIIKDALIEPVWPTRCAICDSPYSLLCKKCLRNIQIIDQLKACPVCGEPYGKFQCCNCNWIKNNSDNEINFKKCISFSLLDKNTGRIIGIYKDAGEQRLSNVMSYFMASIIPKNWLMQNNIFISYIPSTHSALSKRGFDHCRLLASKISKRIKVPFVDIFSISENKDQRELNRKERQQNLNKNIWIKNSLNHKINNNISCIIVDDVYTTGSTLNNAAGVLLKAGASNVYCLTFSRTF